MNHIEFEIVTHFLFEGNERRRSLRDKSKFPSIILKKEFDSTKSFEILFCEHIWCSTFRKLCTSFSEFFSEKKNRRKLKIRIRLMDNFLIKIISTEMISIITERNERMQLLQQLFQGETSRNSIKDYRENIISANINFNPFIILQISP